MEITEGDEKAGLKLNIQKTKIMASCPITSWQIDEEKMETKVHIFKAMVFSVVTYRFERWTVRRLSPEELMLLKKRRFLGVPWTAMRSNQWILNEIKISKKKILEIQNFRWSKITTEGDFSHKIKRCLLLGRKVMTNLDSILKSRDITLSTKVHLLKAVVFPVIMYGCESWTIKKAEHWRIDAFQLWCWRRLLRVTWTARRCNQSILKEISPGCSLEGLMLKLKLQFFGHLMGRPDSFEKTLMLGKIEGRREGYNKGWYGWMASLTQWTWVWVNYGSWWWTGRPGVLQFMGLQRVGHNWATELNWTERKSRLNVHWKDWCWSWSSNTLGTWYEELTHWIRPWCRQKLKAKGEVGGRAWGAWMVSSIQWTWIWANFGRQWRTEKPGVL